MVAPLAQEANPSLDSYPRRWLREGSDGLFRPDVHPTLWEESAEALVPVRTQYMPKGPLGASRTTPPTSDKDGGGSGGRPGAGGRGEVPMMSPQAGWRLLTLKSTLLDPSWVQKQAAMHG